MHARVLVLSALASLAVADVGFIELAAQQQENVAARAIVPRDAAECTKTLSAASSKILADMPTPPPEYARVAATANFAPTDPCVDPVITGTDASIISAYFSSSRQWQRNHITDSQSIWAACGTLSEYQAGIVGATKYVCSTDLAKITAPLSSTKNAAPRETGLGVAAAVGMAGYVVAQAL